MTASARHEKLYGPVRAVVSRDGGQKSSEMGNSRALAQDNALAWADGGVESGKGVSEGSEWSARCEDGMVKSEYRPAEEQNSRANHSVSMAQDVLEVSAIGDCVVADDDDESSWKTRLLTFLDDQWFLICMGILIILASQVQVPRSHQTTKSRTISYLCVCIIFFATGGTLDTAILIRNYARWKTHLWVQGQCFLLCSAIMFGIVSATATSEKFMDPGLLVGLVFMSCIPTTLASNVVMTAQAEGNQELTVVQVTLGNFIGVFITPALVVMYTSVPTWYNDILPSSNSAQFAGVYRRVLKQLGLSIFVPLAIGQTARYLFPDLCNNIFKKNPVIKRVGSICMLVIIWSTYDQAFSSGAFGTVAASNKIFLVFILLAIWIIYLGISIAASLCLFPKKDIVAIAYCVTGKGPATGIPLSVSIFSGLGLELESKIQIPIVIYQSLSVGFGSMMIALFRKWLERDEPRRPTKMSA